MFNILIADDNPEVRSSLRLLLETRLDIEQISEARDMEHVLALVEDTHPDGIILDWELPGRPTRSRINVLKALAPNLRVIILNTRLELRDEILLKGADAFICKTDPPDILLKTLQHLFLVSQPRKNSVTD